MKPADLEKLTKISHISIDADEALPKVERVLEVMGYRPGEAPIHAVEAAEQAISQAAALMDICGGYRVVEFELSPDRQSCRISGIEFNIGRIIGVQLRKASAAAVFLCTIGEALEILARRLMSEGDYLAGFAVDITASEAVELAMDRIQEQLEKEQSELGFRITNRYSPGYCGWSVAEQKKLFSLLPAGFCGVSLNDSCLMTPIKSVSGIIGIGKDVKKAGYACSYCDAKGCIYRKKTI